jgi:hypothetical protein
MRTLMLGAVLALALPAAAIAQEDTPSPKAMAAKACKTEKSEMGNATFKQTYAAKSVGKAKKACLAKNAGIAQTELKNAAHTCKAQRESDAAGFQAWGTNENGKNAYGKCVSATAKGGVEEATENRVSAADTCKAMKKDDATSFTTTFGEKKNAFGKCVSKTAAELEETEQTTA